jgi:hypothetical protein
MFVVKKPLIEFPGDSAVIGAASYLGTHLLNALAKTSLVPLHVAVGCTIASLAQSFFYQLSYMFVGGYDIIPFIGGRKSVVSNGLTLLTTFKALETLKMVSKTPKFIRYWGTGALSLGLFEATSKIFRNAVKYLGFKASLYIPKISVTITAEDLVTYGLSLLATCKILQASAILPYMPSIIFYYGAISLALTAYASLIKGKEIPGDLFSQENLTRLKNFLCQLDRSKYPILTDMSRLVCIGTSLRGCGNDPDRAASIFLAGGLDGKPSALHFTNNPQKKPRTLTYETSDGEKISKDLSQDKLTFIHTVELTSEQKQHILSGIQCFESYSQEDFDRLVKNEIEFIHAPDFSTKTAVISLEGEESEKRYFVDRTFI